MLFTDRTQAATLLATALQRLDLPRPLVLGIPRGGVVLAAVIADALGGDLDVVLVRKLGAPDQPEAAIGAIDEFGNVIARTTEQLSDLPPGYLTTEARQQQQCLVERRQLYTPVRPAWPVGGRNVIVVDDGVATGFTMLSAVRAVQRQRAAQVVVAVPVGSPRSLKMLRAEADRVVCLHAPIDFRAVGAFYQDFSLVTESTVIAILAGVD